MIKRIIYMYLANFYIERAIRYQDKKKKAKAIAVKYAIKGGIYK